MDELDEEEDRLRALQVAYRKDVLHYAPLLADSDRRVTQFTAAENLTRTERQKKETELARMGKELEQLRADKERVAERLDALRPYETYLQSVQAELDYPDVVEVQARVTNLQTNMNAQMKRNQEQMRTIDSERRRMVEYVQESSSRVLQDNNRISQLQKRLEKLRSDTTRLELKVEDRQKRKNREKREVCEYSNSLRNIGRLAEMGTNVPRQAGAGGIPADSGFQLNSDKLKEEFFYYARQISERLDDYIKICSIPREEMAREGDLSASGNGAVGDYNKSVSGGEMSPSVGSGRSPRRGDGDTLAASSIRDDQSMRSGRSH